MLYIVPVAAFFYLRYCLLIAKRAQVVKKSEKSEKAGIRNRQEQRNAASEKAGLSEINDKFRTISEQLLKLQEEFKKSVMEEKKKAAPAK